MGQRWDDAVEILKKVKPGLLPSEAEYLDSCEYECVPGMFTESFGQYVHRCCVPEGENVVPFPQLSAGLPVEEERTKYGGWPTDSPLKICGRAGVSIDLYHMVEYRMMAYSSSIALVTRGSYLNPGTYLLTEDLGFSAWGIGKHVKWSPNGRYAAILLAGSFDYLVIDVRELRYVIVPNPGKSLEVGNFEILDGQFVYGTPGGGSEYVDLDSLEWLALPAERH